MSNTGQLFSAKRVADYLKSQRPAVTVDTVQRYVGPPRSASLPAVAGHRPAVPFVSAEDFDVTGVLAGMDCSESRYWWVPELHTDAGDVFDRDDSDRVPRVG